MIAVVTNRDANACSPPSARLTAADDPRVEDEDRP